ncbi:MAG: Ig-like domain-containing protein [Bacteroidales bacterium]|nr:Ig-like domain-containing protein [Bacteroidales bacterium]
MKRFLPLIILLSAVFGPLLFVHSCANTTEAPSGGKKDTIPPYIIGINPLPGTINVPTEGVKFVFTFDEYVTIKNAENIFLSPPKEKSLKSKLKGKNLTVWSEVPLDSNTTYTISFTDAIADNNEGNMFPGYTYTFSTGDRIDSMMITGTVQDCNTLNPVKGATVLLYEDLTDSAVFKHRPSAAVKTDDWGYFALPFIEDTRYRLYAITDNNNNNFYDPDSETIGFVDSIIRPVMVANDTVKEMLRYDMKDTLSCLERYSEYNLRLFREKPRKQYIMNKARTSERSGYITFMAPNAWVDSVWFRGYKADRLISQFNILNDSLEIWFNDRGKAPDTLKLMVSYRKTDSLGRLRPALEQVNLFSANASRNTRVSRRDIKHEDTICVYTLKAEGNTVEQEGFKLEFNYPVINESFKSIKFRSISPRQKEEKEEFTVEPDTLNPRKYTIRPKSKLLPGYEYIMNIPQRTFRDIYGFWNDSTEVKVSLPNDDKLSSLTCEMRGVDRRAIVELMNEQCTETLRRYVINEDCTLEFPYLTARKYCLRITEDINGNSFVDTGSVLDNRQPERVVFYKIGDSKFIEVRESTELFQTIDLGETLK